MALRYWVGGNGTWNIGITANWSATSGGPPGASSPTADDDVIFNSASSPGTYVVQCGTTGNVPVCKSITTTAPAAGTLTFTKNPDNTTLFNVFNGNINIHGGCLFPDGGNIIHAPSTAGTYTTTFNNSGTNTQFIGYFFTQNSASTTLNFCNSVTATIGGISLSVGGTVVCTNATLTSAGPLFGPGATAITMTNTTIISTVNDPVVGGSNTTTWAISGLSFNISNVFSRPNVLSVGRDSPVQPTAMGSITLTSCTGNMWAARATSVSIGGGGDSVTLGTGLTATGGLTLNSTLINPGFTCSFGGTSSIGGTYVSESNSANTTFTGPVSVLGGTFYGSRFQGNDPALALGTLTFSGGVTLPSSSGENSQLYANVIVADSLTATNSYIYAATSLTVNGGAGKTFSYTINTSSFRKFFPDYPSIVAPTASITASTISFVGASTRRVVYGLPRSRTKTTNDTLTISGSTPTLTNVTFLGTTINNGTSNFSGTRLGTDGLSSGFFAPAGVSKFVVTTPSSTVAYDSAIWALSSGGATSVDNYPLPQDTVIFDSVSDNAVVTYAGQIHIGNVVMTATNGKLLYTSGEGQIFCYGDILLTGAAPVFCRDKLQITQSGNTNRYLTKTQTSAEVVDSSSGTLTVDPGNVTTLAVSGAFRSLGNLLVWSGNNEYLAGTQFGWNNGYMNSVRFRGGTNTMRGTEFDTIIFSIGVGTVFPSGNYTVEASSLTVSGFSYSNEAPTTALNGSVRVLRTNLETNAYIGGTSSTNPLKSLFLQNAVGGSPFIDLFDGNIFLESFTTGTNLGWSFINGGGVRGFVKTNGGTVSVANVTVNNCTGSPLNTFYATGSSSLVGTTTGWTLGAAPASPPSGGFIFF